MAADADRHLLFGLLALQNCLIDQDGLVAAFRAWTRDKARPLADHLQDLGLMDAEVRQAVEAMAALHLKKHGGDPEKSLAGLPAGRSTRERLEALADPDLSGTAARLGSISTESEPDRTTTYSVGTATDDGRRFRVLRPHARGGLGAVFVALDEELHREVALKQIHDRHADDPVSRQRFLLEAQVTGGLEHPGIVPVYGLGSYADGRPYYAMRFIRGDSLKDAIERFHKDSASKQDPGWRSLEMRKLLRRFVDVCNAIDYAHSRGILHRDIKPGNIIVGRHGETLVVDWGLAKATGKAEPGCDERTLLPSSASGSSETLPGSALGTPAYMSPEQARGELDLLGPRSDVYSLGATLYCLLTGKAPFGGDDPGAILRRVERGDFLPPRAQDPTIDRALEAVCLKAMANAPEDRYASCRMLAEDIERWMADESVSAWREPWTRTLGRWASRHRTRITGVAAAGLVALAGLGTVAVVQSRARAVLAAKNTELAAANVRVERTNAELAAANVRVERTNAELARANSRVEARFRLAMEAIRTFHTGVSEDFLLKEAQFQDLRDRLLKSATDFYGKLGALLGQETDIASRRALTAANFELAELTRKVGRTEDALATHQAVLAAREVLAREAPASVTAKVDTARSLTAFASLLASTGKTDEALAAYLRCEALLAGLPGNDPATRAALADCRSRRGVLLTDMGKTAEAMAAYRLARADQEALAAVPGATTDDRRDLTTTITRISNLLKQMGNAPEAEAEYRTVLALRQKLADEHPAVADFRFRLAGSRMNLGILLSQTGRRADAEAECRAALELYRKLAADHPAVTEFQSRLAQGHLVLGELLREMGKTTGAEIEARAALELYRKLAADHPAVTEFQTGLAQGHVNRGVLLSETGRSSGAESEYRAALALFRDLAGAHPTVAEFRNNLAHAHDNLGALLSQEGRAREAEAEYRAGLALRRQLADDSPAVAAFRSDLGASHNNLGDLLMQAGRMAEAEVEQRAALRLFQELVDNHPTDSDFRFRLAACRFNHGIPLSLTGNATGAEAEYCAALSLFRELADHQPEVPLYRECAAKADTNLSAVLRRLGRVEAARDHAERAIVAREALLSAEPRAQDFRVGLAEGCLNRGLARRDLGDLAGAADDIRRARAEYDALTSRSGE